MNLYYFDTLKKALEDPNLDADGLRKLVDDTQFFLGVQKIKFETQDPEMQKQAGEEIRELRQILEEKAKALLK